MAGPFGFRTEYDPYTGEPLTPEEQIVARRLREVQGFTGPQDVSRETSPGFRDRLASLASSWPQNTPPAGTPREQVGNLARALITTPAELAMSPYSDALGFGDSPLAQELTRPVNYLPFGAGVSTGARVAGGLAQAVGGRAAVEAARPLTEMLPDAVRPAADLGVNIAGQVLTGKGISATRAGKRIPVGMSIDDVSGETPPPRPGLTPLADEAAPARPPGDPTARHVEMQAAREAYANRLGLTPSAAAAVPENRLFQDAIAGLSDARDKVDELSRLIALPDSELARVMPPAYGFPENYRGQVNFQLREAQRALEQADYRVNALRPNKPFDAIYADQAAAQPPAITPAPAARPPGDLPEVPGGGPPTDLPVGGGAPPPRGDAGIREALASKAEALHVPDNPILGPEGSLRRRVIAPIYNPSANMPREVHVANNARVGVNHQLYGDFNRAAQAAARAVNEAFKTPPTYIGAVKNRVTGTAADYIERPSMYTNVSPELEAARQQWHDALLGNKNTARSRYNVDVGEYVQKDPRGSYVPHVQSKETVDEAVKSVAASLASRGGVAKTRGYDTLFDRVNARPDLMPELDLSVLADRHSQSLSTLASRETFKAGVGGLDKMQVLELTHPKLASKVQALRSTIQRLQGDRRLLSQQVSDGLDAFMESAKEPADVTALRDVLNLQPGRFVAKARAGVDEAQITQTIRELKARLSGLQPALKSADTGDYVLNRDTFRYMTKRASDSTSSVLKTSVNNAFVEGLLQGADELRGWQLGPDFSPLSIQGVLGAMSHPEVPFQSGVGLAKVAFSKNALHELVDPAVVSRYQFATGRTFGQMAALGDGAEFRQVGRGAERLPGAVGRGVSRFNQALERMVEYGTLKAWENDSNLLQWSGKAQNIADHEAANSISKFVPRLSSAETGKSIQRSRLERLPILSTSFSFAPISLAKDVTTATNKLALGSLQGSPQAAWQSLDGRSQLALIRGATFAATWASMSVGSAVINAEMTGKDVTETVKSVLDPNSGRFGNILIGEGGGFGIGGPMRTTIRGLWPVAVTAKDGVVAMPHLANYLKGRTTNLIGTPIALLRDRDYSGRRIFTSDTQIGRMRDALVYGLEQFNMVAGAVIQDIRHGEPENIPADVLSQAAGVNYYDTGPPKAAPALAPAPRSGPIRTGPPRSGPVRSGPARR